MLLHHIFSLEIFLLVHTVYIKFWQFFWQSVVLWWISSTFRCLPLLTIFFHYCALIGNYLFFAYITQIIKSKTFPFLWDPPHLEQLNEPLFEDWETLALLCRLFLFILTASTSELACESLMDLICSLLAYDAQTNSVALWRESWGSLRSLYWRDLSWMPREILFRMSESSCSQEEARVFSWVK